MLFNNGLVERTISSRLWCLRYSFHLSWLAHIGLAAILVLLPIDVRPNTRVALVLELDSETTRDDPNILEPIVVEIELQGIVETVVPHLNLEIKLDNLGGAARITAPKMTRLVSNLPKMPGLFATGTGQGSGDAARGRGAGSGGFGKFAPPFNSLVEDLRRGLDLVVVFDSTSSMGAEIQAVKLRIVQLGQTMLRVLPETRLAFVTYKDLGDNPVVAYSHLTNDLQGLSQFLSVIQPTGGGADIEEAVEVGLLQAINGYQFREDAHKVIIVLGDAPPRVTALPATLELAGRFQSLLNARVNTVSVRTHTPLPEFASIARYGGGESIVLGTHNQILQELLLLVFGRANRTEAIRFLGLQSL